MSTSSSQQPGQSRGTPIVLIVAVVGVIVVVVAAGLFMAFGGSDDDGDQPAAGGPGAPAEEVAEQFGSPTTDAHGRQVMVPINGVGFPLPQDTSASKGFDDPTSFTTAPAGMMWQQTAQIVTPFSTSDGPTRMDGTVPRGFAHTPAGAALASATYTWRMMDGQLAMELVEKAIDPETESYAEISSAAGEMGPNDSPGKNVPRPSAFKVDPETCTPERCAPTATVKQLDGSTVTIPMMAVEWQDGDWVGTYTPDGEQVDGQAPGMTQW